MREDSRDQVGRVFMEVADLPESERAAALMNACGGDSRLRAEVEALLRGDREGKGFLASPRADALVTVDGPAPVEARMFSGTHELTGQVIGWYKLLELIGEGGFGSVWLAEQREPVKRRVALKIIKLGMDTRQVIARFEVERQALAMMDHPNIAKVFDAGTTDTGRPYFVMEYIKGVPILEYCDTDKLDTKARLELFSSVCNAIQHAHQKGIIHRDLKPTNILVMMQDGAPVPKVIDFGIAKATNSELTSRTLFTEHRQMIGTPAYMSPEQAEMSGLDIDTRSDVYSLGVLLYELLTGTTPLPNEELMSRGFAEMMRMIREVEPDKPSTRLLSLGESGTRTAQQRRAGDPKRLGTMLRGDLDWIVMKCLEKDRTRRYETANGLAADIKRHLSDEPVLAGAPSAGYILRKFVKRNRGQVIAAGVVAAALVVGVVGTTSGLVWALSERSRANTEAVKATEAKGAEEKAKLAAQMNEKNAVAQAKRADTISDFVTAALQASDAQNAGGDKDMTILAAMQNAIKDIDSGRFKDDPETEARLQNTIVTILKNNGRLAEAEPVCIQALATWQRLHPGDHQDVASGLNSLGDVRQAQGHYEEAEPVLAQALAMTQRLFPGDNQDVAADLNNLATVRLALGRAAEAEPVFAQSLAMLQRLFKVDNPDVATNLSNLARARQALGKTDEARKGFDEAVAMHRRLAPTGSPMLARVLWRSGSARLENNGEGDAAAALPELEEAAAMGERLLPAEHPQLAEYRETLAKCKALLARRSKEKGGGG